MSLEFLKAWGAEGTVESERDNIRGLVSHLRVAAASPQLDPRLLRSVESMTGQLEASAQDTLASLERQVRMAAPIARANVEIAQGFEEMASLLAAFIEAFSGQNGPHLDGLLQKMEQVIGKVAEARQFVEEWLELPEPMCLGCASRDPGGYCDDCDLDMLIPSNPGWTEQSGPVRLPSEYVEVYQALQSLLAGKQGWPPLQAALEMLEEKVLRASRSGAATREQDERVGSILLHLQGVLDGIQQMRQLPIKRRVSDLHGGWAVIFENARALQEIVPALAAAVGHPLPEPDPFWIEDRVIQSNS